MKNQIIWFWIQQCHITLVLHVQKYALDIEKNFSCRHQRYLALGMIDTKLIRYKVMRWAVIDLWLLCYGTECIHWMVWWMIGSVILIENKACSIVMTGHRFWCRHVIKVGFFFGVAKKPCKSSLYFLAIHKYNEVRLDC